MKKTIKELLLDIEAGIKKLRWFNVKPSTPIIHSNDNVVRLSDYKIDISKERVDELLKEAIEEVNSGVKKSPKN